jgi:hypothetical protein
LLLATSPLFSSIGCSVLAQRNVPIFFNYYYKSMLDIVDKITI